MSNKKFINRTALILAIIALVATTYSLYQSISSDYRIESLETRIFHLERHVDSAIQRKLDDMRSQNIMEEAKVK